MQVNPFIINGKDVSIKDTSETRFEEPNKNQTENEGAALFIYRDEVTGVEQKFALSLRYYMGNKATDRKPQAGAQGLTQMERQAASGLYDFDVNNTVEGS